jgi:hypothetical protein
MQLSHRTLLIAALFVSSSAPVPRAQTAADPSGHWQGTIQAPGMDVGFEIDLAKKASGEFAGTVTIPAQQIKGLPLLKVAVDGEAVTFYARSDQPLKGVLALDGRSMSGDFFMNGASAPFSMTRIGDAKIDVPVRSAPITTDLEGTWNGTVDVGGMQMRLVLTLANQPDGTATGRIVNLDEGGLQVPVVITQRAPSVTLDTTGVVSSFSGTLNAAASELAGTITQGGFSAPLTFRRAATSEGKR